MTGARAVILDRDGVLTVPIFRDGRSFAPRHLGEFAVYPDAAPAVAALKQAGFMVGVATNQPDVGAGTVALTVIEEMHRQLTDVVAVDAIAVCYETRAQATERRKPGAGMLYELASAWSLDLAASYMVGDRASDIEAGRRAGCTTIFIDRGYAAEAKPSDQAATVRSLAEAAVWIVRHAAALRPAASA